MVLASVRIFSVLVSARASDTCIDADSTALLQHHGATVSTHRRLENSLYPIHHDGHCGGGWLGPGTNTLQESVTACNAHCNLVVGCGFFAFCDGSNCALSTEGEGDTNCALYTEAGQCPDDGYNAYRRVAFFDPESDVCPIGYSQQENWKLGSAAESWKVGRKGCEFQGVLSVRGSTCLLPAEMATEFCESHSECTGISYTSNPGWRTAFPGLVEISGGDPQGSNGQWDSCVKNIETSEFIDED